MGMIYSLFDNPHRYKWEPDKQVILKNLVVVKQKSEEWPGEKEDGRYKYIEKAAVRIANAIEKVKLSKAKQKSYHNQYLRLVEEREEVKKKYEEKEVELKAITQRDINIVKKEIADYEYKTVRVKNQIYEIKNYTLTVGHLKALLEDISDDECIIQIVDGYNENYWRNCRCSMLRVLLNADTARGMVPSDPNMKIDP